MTEGLQHQHMQLLGARRRRRGVEENLRHNKRCMQLVLRLYHNLLDLRDGSPQINGNMAVRFYVHPADHKTVGTVLVKMWELIL